MKKFFLFAIAFCALLSCSSDRAKIQGLIEGVNKGELILSVLELNNQKIIDTIKIEDGKIDYSFKLTDKNPNFYYLYYKKNKIASFVLVPGDRIKFSTDTLGLKSVVEGSDETIFLSEVEKNLREVSVKYDSLVAILQNSINTGDTAKQRSLNYELGSLYVKQKQHSIKYIYTHPYSITNVPVLYQKFPNNFPIFADPMDGLIFKRVYDSLCVKYPGSMYVSRLKEEVAYREKSDAFSSKMDQLSESGFPDISLPDQNARIKTLSDLKGKVIVLSFWTVSDVKQKMFNLDLLNIYNKYRDRGLEVYQVCVDTDKTAWARIVAEQKLPWISVCDGKGSASKAVVAYNITEIPTLYIIDRSGNIAAKNIFDSRLEGTISGLI